MASQYIQGDKAVELQLAIDASLEITNYDGHLIGKLVPIGPWIFDHRKLVEEIVSWRNESVKSYSDYTPVNYESTLKYLNKWVINDDRIFFLIYSKSNIALGHIGIINYDSNKGSIENLRRGKAILGSEELIFHAEVRVVEFLFEIWQVKEIVLEVMSYNVPLISLHQLVGLNVSRKITLTEGEKKIFRMGKEVNDAHKKFCRVEMKMSKNDWHRK
jgi:hypothetical protein